MKRVPSSAALRFVVLALVLVLAAAVVQLAQRYFTYGIAYGVSSLQVYPNLPLNRYGANTKLEDDVYDWQLQRDFAALKAGGFGWARQEFLWDQVEPDRKGNHYDAKNQVDAWAKWDRIVNTAQQNGIQLIVRLDYAPAWAAAGNADAGKCPAFCPPPNNPQDFADFAGAVAGRYKGKIHYYQVWNEPNLQHDWAGQPISPARYTALLKAGYGAIKAADPAAVVLSAALAPNRGDSPDNMSDLAFLRGMYAAGAQPYFDILGAQAYGLDHPAYDRQLGLRSTDFPRALLPQTEPFTFDRPVLLHEIMLANHDEAKPIWICEFGWMSLPANWRGNPSPWDRVSAAARLQYTAQVWQRAAAQWPWMGVLNVWYLREPLTTDRRDPTPYFAIMRPDWQPTSVYTAIAAQANAPPTAPTGRQPSDSPAATYGPHGFAEAWRTVQAGAQTERVAGAPGANMSFRFDGNNLYLYVGRGTSGGRGRLTIDGIPSLANLLPADDTGNRILDTYAAAPQPVAPVEVASGLPQGVHQLDLEVLPPAPAAGPGGSRQGNDVALAGFGVTIEQPALRSYLKAGLAAAAALLLLWPATNLARRLTRATVRTGEGAHGRFGDRQASGHGARASRPPGARHQPGMLLGETTLPSPDRTGAGGTPALRESQWPRISVPLLKVASADFRLPPLFANGVRSRLTGDWPILALWIAALALFYLPARLTPTAAGAAVLLALALARPDLGVLLAPAAAPLEFLPKHVGSLQLSLLETLIGLCTLGWVARCYWERRLLLPRGPFTPLALSLLVVGLISLAASTYPRYSLRDYRQVIVEPVLYFLIATALVSPSRIWRLIGIAVAAGVAVAIAGLAGYLLHRGVIAAEGVRRLAGLYPSPDNLALYLDRPLALAGGVALWTSGRRRNLYVLACLPMAAAILLTFTKGAWVAILATCALAGLLVSWKLVLAALGGAAVIVAAALATQVRRLVTLFQFGAGSTTGRRLLLWRSAWHMARTHPLQGIGLDNFLYQYQRYRLPGAESEPFLSHPHNLILDFWLSLGLLGLLWLGWALLTIATVARRLIGEGDQEMRALALGLTASLVVAAIHGLVDNSYFLPDLAVLFWLSLAGLQLLAGRDARAGVRCEEEGST